jgi:RNA polymerase sigma factor (sigma-70 family)
MTDIYNKISKLYNKYKSMCYGLTKDKVAIDDAVQELMLYFLQMNPETLKDIYEKDGEDGLLRYGAVVLRRSLTSVRSPFYYKYKKYYTNLVGVYMTNSKKDAYNKSIYNMSSTGHDDYQWEKLEQIDKELDKLDNWYDKKIFELYYYEGNTLDSLAKKTGISRNSLFTTIDKVREILKAELNE